MGYTPDFYLFFFKKKPHLSKGYTPNLQISAPPKYSGGLKHTRGTWDYRPERAPGSPKKSRWQAGPPGVLKRSLVGDKLISSQNSEQNTPSRCHGKCRDI